MEMPYQLEVLWCRTFQSVLKIGNYFMGYRMPKYLEGPGKIKELGAFLKEKGINDVLVVSKSFTPSKRTFCHIANASFTGAVVAIETTPFSALVVDI